MWALALRYGVHGLLHVGDARNWSARGVGAALGLNLEPSPSRGLGLLLELVAQPVPSGASHRLTVMLKLQILSSIISPRPVCLLDRLSGRLLAYVPSMTAAHLGAAGINYAAAACVCSFIVLRSWWESSLC